MNYVINYLKALILPLIVIILSPLILSIFNLIGLKTYSIFILIIMGITSFFCGIKVGKKSAKKGYINGLIFGIIFVLLMVLLSLFSGESLDTHTLIYYVIIIIVSIFGSMIGIQLKEPEQVRPSRL